MKVFIEQSGEKNSKNVFDKETGELTGTVTIAVTYPFPYGYILGTLADDGDELDCYVLTDKKLGATSVVECEHIGMVEWFEDGEEDHAILATLEGVDRGVDEDAINRITEFAQHFFDDRPDKKCRLGRFLGVEDALKLVASAEDFRDSKTSAKMR